MKLITKAIANKIPALYEQDGKGMDAQVYLKIFNPYGAGTWLVTEANLDTGVMFGCTKISGDWELGYMDLNELESVRVMGMSLERDQYSKLGTVAEMIDK